jgi:hypothetical protein
MQQAHGHQLGWGEKRCETRKIKKQTGDKRYKGEREDEYIKINKNINISKNYLKSYIEITICHTQLYKCQVWELGD